MHAGRDDEGPLAYVFSWLVLLFVLGVTGLGMCGTCYNHDTVNKKGRYKKRPFSMHRNVGTYVFIVDP